MTNKEANLS